MKTNDEPFGYFKAEPFGWTDCAETDEGAVPLYERPDPRVAELERVQGVLVAALGGFVSLVDKGDSGPWDFQSAYEQAKSALASVQKPEGGA